MRLNAEQRGRVEDAKIACDNKEWEEAIRLSTKNLNEVPEEPSSLYLAGYALLEVNKPGLAQVLYRRLSEIDPGAWKVWSQLGKAYAATNEVDISYECFQKALQLHPRNSVALTNMSLIHINRNEPDAAISLANKALAVGVPNEHDRLEALENLAFGHLQKHEWETGWKLFDETMGLNESRKELTYEERNGRWDGSKGKTVCIYGEQGIGDEISFAGAIPDAIRDSRKVVIDCDERLWNLFARSFPEADVYGTRYKPTSAWPKAYQFDHRCSFSGLQKFYRNKTEDFPGTPYLVADSQRRIQWRALLDTLPGLKVGIAWNGGITVTGRVRRSLSLQDMLPILQQKCSFVSLEYRERGKELEKFRQETGIQIHQWNRANLSNDYDDMAALVSELDLVISVTTAVIHLAGALGKECWVLTPPRPRWFYMSDTNRLPWYKSVELFKYQGKWPIPYVADRLRKYAHYRNQLH